MEPQVIHINPAEESEYVLARAKEAGIDITEEHLAFINDAQYDFLVSKGVIFEEEDGDPEAMSKSIAEHVIAILAEELGEAGKTLIAVNDGTGEITPQENYAMSTLAANSKLYKRIVEEVLKPRGF